MAIMNPYNYNYDADSPQLSRCAYNMYSLIIYVLSFLEEEIHDQTDNGKRNPHAGENRINNEQCLVDVHKLFILRNSNCSTVYYMFVL